MDCEELVPVKSTVPAGGIRCALRRCNKCHATRKKLRKWYGDAKRLEEWQGMSIAQRREVVVANKDKGSGRGRTRDVHVKEKASCVDAMRLSSDRPFMTKKQFPSCSLIMIIFLFTRCLTVSQECQIWVVTHLHCILCFLVNKHFLGFMPCTPAHTPVGSRQHCSNAMIGHKKTWSPNGKPPRQTRRLCGVKMNMASP